MSLSYQTAIHSTFFKRTLASLPTPVSEHQKYATKHDLESFLIKQDDLTSSIYGGNKIRKLEFLLGEAISKGAKEVITFGSTGSNHALATALMAQRCGLMAHLVLMPQPISSYVKDNLKWDAVTNAVLHYTPDYPKQLSYAKWLRWKRFFLTGKFPYVIPVGGTCPLGCLGFVNAALEMDLQLASHAFPDFIYAPFGSMGTCVGLAAGMALMRKKCKIIGVRVVPDIVANLPNAINLYKQIEALLNQAGIKTDFAPLTDYLTIRDEFLGDGYGVITDESANALDTAKAQFDMHMDGTYGGKAFACVLQDIDKKAVEGKKVMFYQTKSSASYPESAKDVSYKTLPQAFHHIFETDI
jgi:D-cysteine desulfhydrase